MCACGSISCSLISQPQPQWKYLNGAVRLGQRFECGKQLVAFIKTFSNFKINIFLRPQIIHVDAIENSMQIFAHATINQAPFQAKRNICVFATTAKPQSMVIFTNILKIVKVKQRKSLMRSSSFTSWRLVIRLRWPKHHIELDGNISYFQMQKYNNKGWHKSSRS